MPLPRARVVTLNAALGPLDYRVPDGMTVEPGSVVVAPLGPRQLVGVAWEAERLPSEEVGDNRLRPLAGLIDVPPIPAPLRRLCEWTADYYLAPLGAVLRMALPSSSALDGARIVTACSDKTARVWDLDGGTEHRVPLGHFWIAVTGAVLCVLRARFFRFEVRRLGTAIGDQSA